MASINFKEVINHKNLKVAFKLIDADKSGYISMDELKMVFGKNLDQSIWDQIFNDADVNNDGKISF